MTFRDRLSRAAAALANPKIRCNQQGWGMEDFQATEPGAERQRALRLRDGPPVKGADYGVARILSERTNEIMDLYRMYTARSRRRGRR